MDAFEETRSRTEHSQLQAPGVHLLSQKSLGVITLHDGAAVSFGIKARAVGFQGDI